MLYFTSSVYNIYNDYEYINYTNKLIYCISYFLFIIINIMIAWFSVIIFNSPASQTIGSSIIGIDEVLSDCRIVFTNFEKYL